MEKKVIKRLVYIIQVFKVYGFLIFLFPSFYPLHQDLCLGLKKYNQIRRGDAPLQKVKQLLVQPEFIVIQIDPREYPVLFKQVIRDNSALKQPFLIDLQGVLVSP